MSAATTQTTEVEAKLKKYNAFLAEDPKNLNLLAEVIDLNIYLKNYNDAKSKIIDALSIEKDNPYFKLSLSTIYLAEGDYTSSIEITSTLINNNFTDPEIKFNHGYALALHGEYDEAKEFLLDLYNSEHQFQFLPATLIRTLHHLGEIDEAIVIANQHLQDYPNDDVVMGMLSLLYFDNDDFSNAQLYADKTLALSPNNLDALVTAGGTYIGDERINEASAVLTRAAKLQPDNGRIWVKIGLIDMLNQDLSTAQTNIHKALDCMPEHIGSWHVLGWIQIMQNDVNSAEASFNHALSLDRNFGETYGGLAIIEGLKGNWAAADEHTKKAKFLGGEVMSSYYVHYLKLKSRGRDEEITTLRNMVLSTNKLPNGSTFQDFLNKVSNRNLKK